MFAYLAFAFFFALAVVFLLLTPVLAGRPAARLGAAFLVLAILFAPFLEPFAAEASLARDAFLGVFLFFGRLSPSFEPRALPRFVPPSRLPAVLALVSLFDVFP
jgi:hypothetical protein